MGIIIKNGIQYGDQPDISGKVDKVTGKGLSTNDYTNAEKQKLQSIENGAQVNTITGIKGNSESSYRTGNVNITKANIGLSDVDNTSDINKPISTATQTALNNKLSTSLKGAANGVAELDGSGKVPTSQLPSYVDDVLEYSSLSNFPLTGESGKIYVDTLNNKTYRWSGSTYVEISPSLVLGETSSTAYRGDRGKAAYDHATAKGSAFASGLYKITTNAEGHVTAATAVTKGDITILGIPDTDTIFKDQNGNYIIKADMNYTVEEIELPEGEGTVYNIVHSRSLNNFPMICLANRDTIGTFELYKILTHFNVINNDTLVFSSPILS